MTVVVEAGAGFGSVAPVVPSDSSSEAVVGVSAGVMAAVVSTFAAAGVTLPARQYRFFGEAAADCEQLVVQMDGLAQGSPGEVTTTPTPCAAPLQCVIVVRIWRKTPVPVGRGAKPPASSDLDNDTVQRMVDAGLLMDAANAAHDAIYGPGTAGPTASVTYEPPDGGLAAVRMDLIIAVP